MDGTNIRELESPLAEAQKIKDALKPLGFEILEYNIKNLLGYDFVLHIKFVGIPDISGNDRGRSPADSEEVGTSQYPGNGSDSSD
jgi:hypothetical protein